MELTQWYSAASTELAWSINPQRCRLSGLDCARPRLPLCHLLAQAAGLCHIDLPHAQTLAYS